MDYSREFKAFYNNFSPFQGTRKKSTKALPQTVTDTKQTELGAALLEDFLSHFHFYSFGEEKKRV